MEFDWDDANIDHIARHHVTPEEAEEALTDPNRLPFPAYPGPRGQSRLAILGQTSSGRYLMIILEQRNKLIRVVTARDATQSEKQQVRRRR